MSACGIKLVQPERGTHGIGDEERSAHPATVETNRVGREQHILYAGSQTLNCHHFFGALPILIGIAIEIFQIQAGKYDGRSGTDSLVGFLQPYLDDLLWLAIHRQCTLPVGAHRVGELRFGRGLSEHSEAPRLPSVW